ncbi:cysteine protease inhibitor staphostatin B [Staphylococcus aureus]|uniref:cysteine protease inhibitor staphostatin B n=1 Tax=Staphylococcus aureus TaxID=1280 RepID=UPI00222374D2|nr:cysteine protease inhibitor staphostatin B [Staphylococcus aureus]MCW1278212.1 cysteine protease inhibitor staphostatin B [Staphylococcus aureus]
MYPLQFIHIVYHPTKHTHLEQTNTNIFIVNWSNQQLQKSICIRHGDDTSHNQYHILFIDTAHQRIKFSSFDNEEIIYILDYDDTQHILMQTSSKQGIGTSRPIVYERLV